MPNRASRRLLGATLVACSPSCDRPPPPPEPPPPIVAAPAQGDDPDTEQQHTYRGHGEDEADGGTGQPPATAPAQGDDRLTVDDANALVSAAIDEAIGPDAERAVTIALPPAWPLPGSELVYYVYGLAPELGSVSRYKLSSPAICVHLDVAARTTRIVQLGKPGKLGIFEHPRVRSEDAVGKAEQALLDLAAGRVQADKVRYLLHGYEKWFDTHGTVGADAEKRAAAFAKWAREWRMAK